LRTSVIFLFVVLFAAASCTSNYIFVGHTKLTEKELRRLLEVVPDSVRLVSAHESESLIKESPSTYSRMVVVTDGRVRIAGRPYENQSPIVIDISRKEPFAPGESKEIGTDYFVYLVPAPVGRNFHAIISKHHPDWTGYFSAGNGKKPRGYSSRTWKLLGYFHIGPQGGILRNSVVTNGNLNDPEPGVPLPGMVKVGGFAIDIYESSELNGRCISAFGRTPLTGLTCDEARLMASLSGKRLPSSRQWLQAVDPETFPQVLSSKPVEEEGPQNCWSSQIAVAGHFALNSPGNIASSGCVDMVGNVWEWCDELLDFVMIEELPTAAQGYISEAVTFMGIPYWPSVTSVERAAESLGYFYFDPTLSQGTIARGGAFDDGDKAGPVSLLLNLGRQGSSEKVGLRCVR